MKNDQIIGLISKKATLHVQHIFCTFLCPCFARLQRKTSRNFLVTRFVDEMSNVVRQFLFIFFFSIPLIFTLEAASCLFSFSHIFSCCSSNKKMPPLLFVSRASSLSPTFSFSLSFSFSTFPYLWT